MIQIAVSLNLTRVDHTNRPVGEKVELVQLLGEVLDANLNIDVGGEESLDFDFQLLDVGALRGAQRGVGVQANQNLDQWAFGDGTSDGQREVLNAPVDGGNVEERANDSESFDFGGEDQFLQVRVFDEDLGEEFVDENQLLAEGVRARDDDGDVGNQLFNDDLLRGCGVLRALIQRVNQWARASSQGDNSFDCDGGGVSLDVVAQAFQLEHVSPIADEQVFNSDLDLDVLFEEDLERVVELNQDLVLGQFNILNDGDLSDVDPFLEDELEFNVQSQRELPEDLENEAKLSLFPRSRVAVAITAARSTARATA